MKYDEYYCPLYNTAIKCKQMCLWEESKFETGISLSLKIMIAKPLFWFGAGFCLFFFFFSVFYKRKY